MASMKKGERWCWEAKTDSSVQATTAQSQPWAIRSRWAAANFSGSPGLPALMSS